MKEYNIKDHRKEHWNGFKDYYIKMMYSGDCDPSYPALNYISDRLELNLEQRYWIAFLYGTNYCVPTTFYIYNEFPDYENVNINRLQRWWTNNKDKTFFQTDRARVRNYEGVFVKCFESYRDLVGESQVKTFNEFKSSTNLKERYKEMYKFTDKIYYFGRFSLFNYLETIHELTDLKMNPDELNFKQAESSRNGMCYVCDKQEFLTLHHKKSKEKIDYLHLQHKLKLIMTELEYENPEIEINHWNVETCLCAYKKLFWNTRYLGYYIDRQMFEIYKLQNNVKKGVEWKILWDFRKEFFKKYFLGEYCGWSGIRKKNMNNVTKFGKLTLDNIPEYNTYKRKVYFDSIGNVYDINCNYVKNIKETQDLTEKNEIKYIKTKKIWEYF